jgi:perosamine synthetase
MYREAIRPGGALTAPVQAAGAFHVYHHFTVRAARRADAVDRLRAQGIPSAIYYPCPIHKQPAYARWSRGSLPQTERAAEEVLSIPVHPWLAPEEVARVATALAGLE